MRLAILLVCCAAALGPTNSQSPSAGKPKDQDHGLGIGAPAGKQFGAVDVLSDTQGVDFRPYLTRVMHDVRENWYRAIPECAELLKGKLAIEFAIAKDGKVADMRLVARSRAELLNRSAWAGITASNPFPPLPNAFTGPYIALRFHFYYNPDSSGPESSGEGCTADKPVVSVDSRPKTKSGIAVAITAPLPGDTNVPLGGSKPVTAMVTGAGTRENTVEWNISGFGCSSTFCGEMANDSYHAPTVLPDPPFVTLTATSKVDPGAKASVTLHIIESASH